MRDQRVAQQGAGKIKDARHTLESAFTARHEGAQLLILVAIHD